MLKFNRDEMVARETPNVDFIGSVEVDGESVVYRTYPIDIPRQLFILFHGMVCDDSKSVFDMWSVFDKSYPAGCARLIDPNFLAPRALDDRYVDYAGLPKRITKEELRQRVNEIRAYEAKKRSEKDGHDRQSVKTDVGQVPSLPPVEVCIEKRLRKYKRILKWSFFRQFIRFQAAFGYGQALAKNRIRERLGYAVRMFSTDTIGWTSYNYEINQDISIRLDSNFGYGHSSYFLLSLMYKGIEIYTFSDYVRYPYANMRVLIGHTRTYRVERDSWPDALKFVAETANMAVRSPQSFVETFILAEVRKMMEGLREILRMPRMPERTHSENGRKVQHLGVATYGAYGYKSYKATPDEMLLALKSERVIGALAVLEKLKALDAISVDVGDAIRELIRMVKASVPELERRICSIRQEVHGYGREEGFLRSVLWRMTAKAETHEREMQQLVERALVDVPEKDEVERERAREAVRHEYLKSHPEYVRIRETKARIIHELSSIQGHIRQRKAFLGELERCHGVGQNGERFWSVVESLYPHEVAIEKGVLRESSKHVEKNLIRGVDGLRATIRQKYCSEHEDAARLFEERDGILEDVNAFPCCRV